MCFLSLSFRVDPPQATAPRAAEVEVLMQVTHSLSATIRKWLGRLGRQPANAPYGAGAWSG